MKASKKSIRVLSLGAGVQSTALALMSEDGLIEPVVAAVFADTGDEPQELYDHIERLRDLVSFPIHVVRQGPSLIEDFFAHLRGETPSSAQPPFYVRVPDPDPETISAILSEPEPKWEDFKESAKQYIQDSKEELGEQLQLDMSDMLDRGSADAFNEALNEWNMRRRKVLNKDAGGMLWRKCTRDWKIVPVRRGVRSIMKEHEASHVISLIGISTDESQRVSESGRKFITNEHPLIDMNWSRNDCIRYLASKGLVIPKSACVYCPYRSNTGWAKLKAELPHEFERACQIDDQLREHQATHANGAALIGQLFVHRSFTPLRDADLRNTGGQKDFGFEQECDGMCGH